MSPTSGGQPAVFLSYASQDAEAARRICEALRAAGVEVWFDQSELVGGDAWDAKIRKQIKECALFVPVVSPNTNARQEGYFRLEWKLAVDRSHLMADDAAFIVPLAIDEATQGTARVPDKFRDVQWMRVVNESSVGAFADRVSALLGGASSAAAGGPKSQANRPPVSSDGPSPRKSSRRAAVALIAAFAVGTVGFLGWQRWRDSTAVNATGGGAPKAAAVATAAEQFPRDPELARAWQLITDLNFTAEDMRLAEDIIKQVLVQRPADAEAGIVYAWLGAIDINRADEHAAERLAAARRYGERAVQLAPENPYALAGLAKILQGGAERERALQLAQKAIALNPNVPGFYEVLAFKQHPREAGRKTLEDAVTRFPSDAYLHARLAGLYRLPPLRWDLHEPALDRALALAPIGTVMIDKAHAAFYLRGDTDTIKRMLDQLPAKFRRSDRAVFWQYLHAAVTANPDAGLRALREFPGAWLRDMYYSGPKSFLVGDLLLQAGRAGPARLQLEAALADIRKELARQPADVSLRTAEMWTLLGLDRKEEAAQTITLLDGQGGGLGLWFGTWRANLLVGARDKVLPAFAGLKGLEGNFVRMLFRVDPRLAPWRDDPEIMALLVDSGQPAPVAGASTPPDLKSVAVLAFRQLSTDPENEYLCEAISDELCNVLGRVPGLKVAASASAFSFKGRRVRPAEMAAQLGVAFLVDGTVQKIGNRVRVRADLIKASDESVVWKSATLEHEMKDIFAVQDQVVAAIARNLQLQLGGGKLAPVTIDPEAYRLYYEGRRMWSMRGAQEPVDRARALFAQALEKDPNLGRAYAGLADTRASENLGFFGARDSAETAEVRRLTEKAIALEPLSAETHTSHGRMLWQSWRISEAERELRHAVKLNPNHAEAHLNLGRLLHIDGRMDEALVEIQKAMELDPLTSRIFDNYASVLIDMGRHEQALRPAERALVLQPESPQAQRAKLVALSALGRHDEALTIARESAHATHFVAGIALARAGRREEAREWLKNYRGHVVGRSIVLLVLGERDEALDSIPVELVSMSSIGRWFYWPEFDPVRGDPRFLRVLEQVGMKAAHDRAQAWRAAHPPETPRPKQ